MSGDSFRLSEGNRVPSTKYTLLRKIASSGSSEVWSLNISSKREAGKNPVLKYLTEIDESNIGCLDNEIEFLGKLKSSEVSGAVPEIIADIRGPLNNLHGFIMNGHTGVTLEEFVRNDLKFSSIEIADWFTKMGSLLGIINTLHLQGILHRDIKPQNVMIADKYPIVVDELNMWIIDFGIAVDAGTTLDGNLRGMALKRATPGYSPPEKKDTDEILRFSYDIFGVGAIGYFLLTRRHPRRESELPLDPRRHAPAVDLEIAQWIMDCTHPEPMRRFQSATAALERLQAILPRFAPDEGDDDSRWGSLSALSKRPGVYDLVIVMDSTESMTPHRESLRKEFSFLANAVFDIYEDLQVTLIHLGDYSVESSSGSKKARPNPLRWRTCLSSEELENELLMDYVADGGGDNAEAWGWAFSHLARVHKWRPGTNRIILALGDSFSHGFAHRRPFIEEGKFSHFADLHGLGDMPFCFYDYLNKGWDSDEIEDNYSKVGQYIDNPSPMMRKLHKDPATGRVTRPNITKQIRRVMQTSAEDETATIHSIRCGDNKISLKFMQYLAIEGGGFSLDSSEVEYLVPTLLGLLLSENSDSFLAFYENFEHAFVDVSTDLFTSSLGPVTQYVTRGI